MRRGYYFMPKYVFGKPADSVGGKFTLPPWLKQRIDSAILQWFTGDPVRFGFPGPTTSMYESHPVVNSLILYHIGHGDVGVRPDIARFDGHTVHFKDGQAHDYDLVLAATGYKLHYPFLDHALLELAGHGAAPVPEHLRAALRPAGRAGHGGGQRPGLAGPLRAGRTGGALPQGAGRGQPAGHRAAGHARRRARQLARPRRAATSYLKLERMAYYVHKDTYRKAVRAAAAAFA
ncbi:MAG: hypothetical protein QM777_04540 [Pseudorhodoferax sp.]